MADQIIKFYKDYEGVKISVNGAVYRIIEEGDGERVWLEEQGNKEIVQLSYTDFVGQNIYIHEDLNDPRKLKLLAHELTRVICNEFIPSKPVVFNEEELCSFVEMYAEIIVKIRDIYALYKMEGVKLMKQIIEEELNKNAEEDHD